MFVERNAEGHIVGLFANPQKGIAEEWVEGAELYKPPLTEQEMREAEVAQDKNYLADTDWIVAKIGEASLLGEDIAPLLEKYSVELAERENARVRIRLAEGRV